MATSTHDPHGAQLPLASRRVWFAAKLLAWMTLCLGVRTLIAAVEVRPDRSQEISGGLDDELFSDLQPVAPPAREQSPPESVEGQPARPAQRGINGRLGTIQNDMQLVQDRLLAIDFSTTTQRIQSQIVGSLDELIAEWKRQQQRTTSRSAAAEQPSATTPRGGSPVGQQGETGQANGNSRTSASGGASRPGERAVNVETAPVDRNGLLDRAWGNLPPGRRSAMQSARPEKFLPKYARQIEAYFKRLAESQNR